MTDQAPTNPGGDGDCPPFRKLTGYDGSIPGAPSAVDRMAALADPDGSAAARVAQWETNMAAINSLLSVSSEIYRRTKRER